MVLKQSTARAVVLHNELLKKKVQHHLLGVLDAPLEPLFIRLPFWSSHEASLQKTGGQRGLMGAVATPKYREGAYRGCLLHRERKEFGGIDQNCFYHHAFYVGCNVTNVPYSTIKAA